MIIAICTTILVDKQHPFKKDIQIQVGKSQYRETLMTSQTQRIEIRHHSQTITFKKDIQIQVGQSKYIETLMKSNTQHDDGSSRLYTVDTQRQFKKHIQIQVGKSTTQHVYSTNSHRCVDRFVTHKNKHNTKRGRYNNSICPPDTHKNTKVHPSKGKRRCLHKCSTRFQKWPSQC